MAKQENSPQEKVSEETITDTTPVEETVIPAEAETSPEAPVEETRAESVHPAADDEIEPSNEIPEAEHEVTDTPVYDQESAPPAPKDKRPVKYALIGLAVGVLVGFCFNYAATGIQELIKSANATAITAAVSDCKLDGHDGISVSDNGNHLSIKTKGPKDNSGATTQNAVCLVQALSVPQDVLSKLDATKPDGQSHTENWTQRSLTWTFTADNGIKMDMLIKS